MIDFEAIRASFVEDIAKVGSSPVSRFDDVIGYISNEIYKKGESFWTPDIIRSLHDLLFYEGGIKANYLAVNRILSIEASTKTAETYIACRIIVFLFCHAAQKGTLVLPISFSIAAVVGQRPESLVNSHPFRFCLPLCVRELINTSTPSKYAKAKSSLTMDWDGVEKKLKKYKSWHNSSMSVANYMLVHGVGEFADIDPSEMNKYRIDCAREFNSSLPFIHTLEFLDTKYGLSLTNQYRLESSKKSGVYLGKQLGASMGMDNVVIHKGNAAKKIAGEYVGSDAIVLAPVVRSKTIWIDDYCFNLGDLRNFVPESLPNDSWVSSQIDFINSGAAEQGTKKSRIVGLKFLNLYLYSYLKFFFKNNNSFFNFPSTPEEFDSYIFVEFSRVIDSNIKAPREEIIYPLSLTDFVIKLSNSHKQESTANQNYARNNLAVISSYFDYVMSTYGKIAGYRIKNNPLKGKVPNIGQKYSASNKSKFDYFYWLYFRAFTKECFRSLLLDTALRISEEMNVLGDTCKSSEAFQLARDINSTREIPFKDSELRRAGDGKSIDIASELSFSDDFSPLKIQNVNFGQFPVRSTNLLDIGHSLKHLDFQTFGIVCVAAYAGQRAANAAWLNADNFDKDFDEKNKYHSDDLVPLFVHTDKVSTDGIDSQIHYDLFRLLTFAKRVRDFNRDDAFKKPIAYQGNESSKFGSFKPLLQTSRKNTLINYNLAKLQVLFEECLNGSSLPLKSHLFYGPTNLSPVEFSYYKRSESGVPLHLAFEIRNVPTDKRAKFTPLEKKSLHTIHSFRKQLVSVMSVLISDRDAIKMITGQGHATIGYYEDNTIEEVQEIKEHTGQKQPHEIKSVKDAQMHREEVIKSVLNKTFFKDYGGVSNHSSTGKESGVATVGKLRSPDELAFNATHICPSANICPQDVIREVGERNCHICYKAVVTKFHAPAILAKIRSVLDDYLANLVELANEHYSDEEKDDIAFENSKLLQIASAWKVRHDFILNHSDIIVGEKSKVLSSMRYLPPDSIKENLYLRLKEVEHMPALQSRRLKSMANRMSRKLIVSLSNIDAISLPEVEMKMDKDPVSFALKNLELMASLTNVTVHELLESKRIYSDASVLELFDEAQK